MSQGRLLALVLLVVVAVVGMVPPPARAAADVDFVSLEATGPFSGPLLFRARFSTSEEIERVELLARLPRDDEALLFEAEPSRDGDDWVATATLAGGELPNTTYRYRFRVTTEAGEALSDEAAYTVVDDRFEWRTLEGAFVRLHWAEGDEAFARRALTIGDEAIDRISALLGVEEREPIDFFVYADSDAFQEALGPGAREYVAGVAVPEIRTLFGLVRPEQVDSDWVDILVGHELAHLVFDTAVKNPYREPPHWLNEGLAVYLSEGSPNPRDPVLQEGIRRGTVVPLRALAGGFPPVEDRFRLGYAEGVSAVDFFVRTHGQERLVELVQSYARGLTDDDAFLEATGEDFDAFEAAWMADIGLDPPPTFGPQPAPAAPVPSDWVGPPPVTTAAPGSGAPATAGPSASVGGNPSAPGTGNPSVPAQPAGGFPVPLLLAAALLAAGGLVLVLVALRRGGAAG